jgi:nitrate reductase NapAB chaperone NapD
MCGEAGESMTEKGSGNPEPGLRLDTGATLVAGVVIETIPHRAPRVEYILAGVDGLQIVGGDGDRRLAGVWTAASGEMLLAAVEELVQTPEDILGIFPTFIGTDEEEDATIRKD